MLTIIRLDYIKYSIYNNNNNNKAWHALNYTFLSRLLSSDSAPDSYPEADDEDKLDEDDDAKELCLRCDQMYDRKRWDNDNIYDEPGNLNEDNGDDEDDDNVEWS